jgi:hypothetical protein
LVQNSGYKYEGLKRKGQDESYTQDPRLIMCEV